MRKARERRVLTQAQLAERASVSEITLSRMENSRGVPKATTIQKIARALDVDPAWSMLGHEVAVFDAMTLGPRDRR